MKLSDRKIISIVRNELQNSIDFSTGATSGAAGDIDKPLRYYTGQPNGREQPGKSTVTSTDVADAIEWLMPQIMNALTQNNQVVEFDPTAPDDELQAKVESNYCHDTFMKYNDGFVQTYYFVKDALLHRNGIFKVYYEKDDKITTEKFTGLAQEQFQMLLANPNVELMAQSGRIDETGVQKFDVKIRRKIDRSKICIVATPLEEFRVNSNHNSILLDGARFTAHVTKKTVSDLITEGYSKEKLKNLPEYEEYQNYMRFYLDAEQDATNNKSVDDALKELSISECYMQMDIDQDGVAEYVKIVMAGSDTGSNAILSVDELDYCPWVSGSPILMSHKFLGLSIYDRLKEIQDQKTALIRNIFDNFYLQNNQRYKILENQVDLKDLLVSRAGGVVKVKTMDSIMPLETTPFGPEALSLMNYLDTIRAGRVGVSAEGSTAPNNIGDRVGTLGVAQLMAAKEELVNLIVRTLAETSIKPLMFKIRELARSNLNTELHYKFMNMWVKTNPAMWRDRTAISVRVGTGTGNVADKLVALKGIFDIQSQILQSGQPQVMVDEPQLFATLNELCELSGLISADKYFNNPSTPQARQSKKQMQESAAQEKNIRNQFEARLAESQIKLGDAEVQKAAAQMENVRLKGANDSQKLQFEFVKLQLQDQIENLKQELATAKSLAETSLKKQELELKEQMDENATAIKLTELEIQSQQQEDANFIQNMQIIENSQASNNGENSDE